MRIGFDPEVAPFAQPCGPLTLLPSVAAGQYAAHHGTLAVSAKLPHFLVASSTTVLDAFEVSVVCDGQNDGGTSTAQIRRNLKAMAKMMESVSSARF